MTLTVSNSNDVGGSPGDEGRCTGLTDFGRTVVAEMERLGTVIDHSHVSDPLFWDAIRAVPKPVIASLSSSRQPRRSAGREAGEPLAHQPAPARREEHQPFGGDQRG